MAAYCVRKGWKMSARWRARSAGHGVTLPGAAGVRPPAPPPFVTSPEAYEWPTVNGAGLDRGAGTHRMPARCVSCTWAAAGLGFAVSAVRQIVRAPGC
jgi:hypothetical protein